MQATAEYVQEFLNHVNQPEWATDDRWPQLWSMSNGQEAFEFQSMAPDPYELLPTVVDYVKNRDADTFFIMTGWMTKVVDEDDEDYDEFDEPERQRVRVILGASPKLTPFVAVERAGEGFVEIFEDMGEGMFPDVYNQLMADN